MEYLRKIILLTKLGRFHFLFGGILLYCTGVLLGSHLGLKASIWKVLFGYVIFGCAHLSVSYSNDYFDYNADRYNEPSTFSGGSGVLQKNPELRSVAKRIAIALILISIILGIFFTLIYSIPILFMILVICGNLLGWFYSAPPISLSYRGLGEISTMITVGFLVPFFGYYTVAGQGSILSMGMGESPSMFFILIPMLLYGLSFILNVQIPDMEADKLGGKNTVVTRRGRKFTFTIIALSNLSLFCYFFIIGIHGVTFNSISVLVIAIIALIPLLASGISYLRRTENINESKKLVQLNMASIFLFPIVLNIYLYTIL